MNALVALVLMLTVVGLLVYGVQTFLPVTPTFKNLISFVLVVLGVLWLCLHLGAVNYGGIHF